LGMAGQKKECQAKNRGKSVHFEPGK